MSGSASKNQRDYKGKTPIKVRILETTIPVKNWRDLFIKCAEELIKRRPDEFNGLSHSSQYSGRYISAEDLHMREPYQLSNGLFIETHYGSNSIVRILENKLIKGCGLKDSDLKIFLKE